MRLLASLFAVSVLVLGASVWPACSPNAGAVPVGAVRVECDLPAALSLRRFEDGSAWLLCAGRILARVSVPS
jgi:hypothetical protein